MKRTAFGSPAAWTLGVLTLACAAGCASSGSTAAPSPATSKTEARARCRGTLGFEAAPVSRKLRKALKLPEDFRGAIVGEVLPGGPAAAAGIRANDIVVTIGGVSIANDCEQDAAAFDRACEPVHVVLRRGGATVEADLVLVDQDTFYADTCGRGVETACFRQALLLWHRDASADRDRAIEIFDTACRAGHADSCAYEGLRLTDREGRSKDALAAANRACDLGSAAGCAHLAFLYATGKIVARDDRRATPLYVKSCDLGDAKGCYNAGLMADDGRGVAANAALAVTRYREACEMGSSTACTNLGFHYEYGRGVAKDTAKSLALYRRGCEGTRCQPSNLGGCVNVGRAYRDGIGIEKSEPRAAEIFREACGRKPDSDDVESAQNGARACSLLGGLYIAGDGIPKDLAEGRRLSEHGCDRGDSFGCFNAAAVYGSGADRDPEKAAHFLDRACAAGDAVGCFDLGVAYEKGNGVSREARRAAELYKKACGLGFAPACAKKGR